MKSAYSVEQHPPSISEYNALRQSAGWEKCDETRATQALNNSLFSVVGKDNDVVIAMGRVIGDGLYYYIQDLIVHPDHHGRGIGTALMENIMTFLHKNVQTKSFIGLMAAEGLVEFYLSFGFQKRSDIGPGMFKVITNDGNCSTHQISF